MHHRTITAIAALALSLLTTATLARSASIGVSLSASVPKYCRAGSSVATIDVAVTFQVDAEGALVTKALVPVPGAVCNAAALITMRSLGSGARSASTIGTSVHYVATTRFGTTTVTLDTTSVTSTGTTSAPQLGSVSVAIVPVQPAVALVPGTVFADTLRISLTPL